MFNIAPFITKFVRSLHDREENIEVPYSMTQFGVVLMADVVGFSKLTTLATERGESAPEAIASEIGEYMGECIKIIEFYGGDVVKFLGDALLVCFQPTTSNERRRSSTDSSMDDEPQGLSQRQKHVLVRKAIECGLQLLARQSHFRVYLTAEEIIRHRGPGGEIQRHHHPGKDQPHRVSMFDSVYDSKTSGDQKKKSLSDDNGQSSDKTNNGNVVVDTSGDSTKKIKSISIKPRLHRERTALQQLQDEDSVWHTINPFKKRHIHRLLSKMADRRRSSNNSSQASRQSELKSIDLELHIAVSCGNVTNVILGDINPTGAITETPLIYTQGSNGDISDSQSKRNKSFDDSDDESTVVNGGSTSTGGASQNKRSRIFSAPETGKKGPVTYDDYFLHYRGRLEYAVGGEAVEALDKALAGASAGEISITPEAFEVVNEKTMALPYEKRNGYYVVKGFDFRKNTSLSRNQQQQRMVAFGKPNADYLSDRPGLINQANQLKIEPLVPKTRDTSYLNLTTDPSLHYFKYLNRSSLYRLQHNVEGNFPAQFREATIMFISLGKIHVNKPEGLHKAQRALFSAIRRLVKYEGMLQQFAVDDKGATILGIFGLPPLSHESEATFAAKAAIKLRDEYRQYLPDFSIALASGGIFNAVLPMESPYRRDAAIAGDAIIIAVRMLKFPFAKRNIVCDQATRKQIGFQCEFEDFGTNYVKGKKEPVQIYGLINFNTRKNTQISLPSDTNGSTPFVGYRSEMENALTFMDNWREHPNHHLLVISGNAGSGKSLFCRTLHQQYIKSQKEDFITCWTSATEVEKSTKYYTIRNLVMLLLELIDSDKVPTKIRVRRQADCAKDSSTRDMINAKKLISMEDSINSKSSNKVDNRLSMRSFHNPFNDLISSPASGSKKHRSFNDFNSGETPTYIEANTDLINMEYPNSVGSTSEQSSAATSPAPIQPAKPAIKQMRSVQQPQPLTLQQQQQQLHQQRSSANYTEEEGNEMIELVRRCLHKCGESGSLLPLFRDLALGTGDVPDNRHTRNIDGRARDILLISVVGRMMQYISQFVSLLVICDDMQWADAPSIALLQHIHKDCKRVMILLVTRTIKGMNIDFIDDFCETGTTNQIALNGVGTADIGKIILQNCGAGVERVNPSIVHVVQERTHGNPLYVTNIAIILKDFDHVTVYKGELIPTSNQFELANFLGNFNYSKVIKIQFDRLNSNYQEFLTVASCLDQTFSIYEVGAAIQPSNTIYQQTNLKLVLQLLKRYDVYNFLNYIGDKDGAQDASNEGTNKAEKEVAAEYSFLHDTIPKTIYEMISYEHRITLHRCLARYYEKLLTTENQAQILGKVTRHYLQTDELSKQVYYLQELADYNLRSYLLPEATAQLERIVKILKENEDLAAEFGWLQLSDIYYRLGVCFAMRTELNEGERCLFMALSCLDKPWPRSRISFFIQFWRNWADQYKHRHWNLLWNLTRRRLNPELAKRIVDIMRQLSNIYVYTGNGRSFAYTSLVGLNACEDLGDTGSNYTLFLARHSLVCWLNEKRHNSVYYMSQALRNMNDQWHADTLSVCAYLYFAAGKFHDARALAYTAIENTQTFGVVTDCQAFYRAVALVMTTRIFEGVLDECTEDLNLMKLMSETARINRDYEAEIWLGVYSLGNSIVTNNLEDCSAIVAHLESQTIISTNYNAIAIHGVLLCYYIRKLNYDQAHTHIRPFLELLPSLTVTPNIFPIYGLIFAMMGFYELLEDKDEHLISLERKDNYDKFNQGVARINNAFQQVKLWEFAEPSLYLARAFPYISTGRIVEGYLVLRHGFFEMKFINEIKFLKSYYCSILGKYAFTPEDRVKWTEKAAADLESIDISPSVYCNPDPRNSYHEGKPADYTEKSNEGNIVV